MRKTISKIIDIYQWLCFGVLALVIFNHLFPVPSLNLMQIAQDVIDSFNPFGGLEGGRPEDPYDFVNNS